MTINTRTQPITHEQSGLTGTPTRRAIAVAASTLAAGTTWMLADVAAGLDVTAPSFDPAGLGVDLGIGPVGATAASATLLGWGLLVFLERTAARPKLMWTAAAIGATLITLAGPLSGTGVTISQRLTLIVLHLIVSAIYVPLMRRTIPTIRAMKP